MAGSLMYDPEMLNEMSGNLTRGSASVMSQLSTLRNQLAPIHDGFQGAAASGFEQLWQQWQQSGQQLQQSLDGLAQLLKTAATNAADMEQRNASMMNQG